MIRYVYFFMFAWIYFIDPSLAFFCLVSHILFNTGDVLNIKSIKSDLVSLKEDLATTNENVERLDDDLREEIVKVENYAREVKSELEDVHQQVVDNFVQYLEDKDKMEKELASLKKTINWMSKEIINLKNKNKKN